jgi:hypothetical protein
VSDPLDRVLNSIDALTDKVDDVRLAQARVEEQVDASERAREHARANSKMAVEGLTAKVVGLSDAAAATAERTQRLEIRVVELEVARKLLDDQWSEASRLMLDQARQASIKGGGIGGVIATAVATGMLVVSWLAGFVNIVPRVK